MKASDAESRYGRIAGLFDLPVVHRRRVALVGQGSLLQPVGSQLLRHGVGTAVPGRIRLIDGDRVEARNLIGTEYRMAHLGLPKVEAAAAILAEINPDVNVTLWHKHLQLEDIPALVDIAHQTDLLVHGFDSFELMNRVADACDSICPQVAAFFGPRCDYAEIAFSVPGITQRLTQTLGQRKLSSIGKPEALGEDTAFVSAFVAALCLRVKRI
jgi:tRNA A37 threonylcarbamoyladenosine dehydratase